MVMKKVINTQETIYIDRIDKCCTFVSKTKSGSLFDVLVSTWVPAMGQQAHGWSVKTERFGWVPIGGYCAVHKWYDKIEEAIRSRLSMGFPVFQLDKYEDGKDGIIQIMDYEVE